MDTLNTIVEKYRLNLNERLPIQINIGRLELAGLFAELDFKTGAEIGVEQGLYTEVLCKANPRAAIYAADAWQAYNGYREHVSQEKLDGFYGAAKRRLAPYNCYLLRGFSRDISSQFDDNWLDFVYIDSNHDFQYVVNDLAEWSKKVRPGGIIAGHDYRKDKGGAPFHVKYAVDGFTAAYRVSPWFVLRGDKSASFMWVKE